MLRQALPYAIYRQLFGDRRRYGTVAPPGDPDWERWLANYPEIYSTTQRSDSIPTIVNEAGYRVLRGLDLTGKRVVELGPGGCFHFRHLRSRPELYTALDIADSFLATAREQCAMRDIPFEGAKLPPEGVPIPLPSGSADIFFSFYSLEHAPRLGMTLDEIFRVLKPGGVLIGGIPTEGSLAWGGGRWLTSRRVLRDQFGFDAIKLICWEHPNFVDTILKELERYGILRRWKWPLPFLPLDFNLVVSFEVVNDKRANPL